MPKGNIILTALSRLRPGGAPGFRGISIIDTSSDQSGRPKGIVRPQIARDQIDSESASYPVALAVSNVPPRYPTGILNRTNRETGNIAPYEADDDEVLARLFGVGTRYYNTERREV